MKSRQALQLAVGKPFFVAWIKRFILLRSKWRACGFAAKEIDFSAEIWMPMHWPCRSAREWVCNTGLRSKTYGSIAASVASKPARWKSLSGGVHAEALAA
ncbi:hypothetical protein [Hydrocarboniphaga effusa]|nr:hypothetical protein [Hydrocarboniphaga effusa]